MPYEADAMVGLVIPRIVRYYPNEVANPENRSVMCPSGLDGEIGRGRAVRPVLRNRFGHDFWQMVCGVCWIVRGSRGHADDVSDRWRAMTHSNGFGRFKFYQLVGRTVRPFAPHDHRRFPVPIRVYVATGDSTLCDRWHKPIIHKPRERWCYVRVDRLRPPSTGIMLPAIAAETVDAYPSASEWAVN